MLLAPEATLADGRYRLLEARAVGGMSTVWLAHDERLDRSVAVKVISDSLAVEADFVRRFEREAQVAARLSHPSLVRLFDFGTEEGRPFLVSEWIDGPDLQELRKDGVATDGDALAVDLLGALEHIHRAGIVHRDVKPSNVLLDRDGRARLTDFGIAQPEDGTRLTQTGMVMGTAPFIAPEVLRGQPSTRQSDLYSVGLLLEYVLGDTASQRLSRLIAALTADDPADRPGSAADALALVAPRKLRLARVLRPDIRRRTIAGPPTQPLASPTPTEAPTRAGPSPSEQAPLDPGEYLSHQPQRRTRALVVVPLVLAMVAVAVALLSGGEGETPPGTPAAERFVEGGSGPDSGEGAPEPAIPQPRSETDPARGSELNDEGFALIGAGQYDEAVRVLRRAVSYFPADTDDLTYAYALFNLGNALRLAGRPEEAIPVLEARLEIPDQTETVAEELALAREEAGVG